MSNYQGMPIPLNKHITETSDFFQALDNFSQTFCFRKNDKVLMLADPLLDRRVIDAVRGHAKARGAEFRVYMEPSSRVEEVPEHVKGLVEQATFVVSTWFCSITDLFFINKRRAGQRWIKITYFRDFDLLKTPQARFPIDLVGEITRATAALYPTSGEFDLHFTDERGSDFKIHFTEEMRNNMLATNRWRGKMAADEDGCYVHYLASHGPNLWDHNAVKHDMSIPTGMSGVLYPQWAVGFPAPFAEKIGVHFEGEYVSHVTGESKEAYIMRDMLVGGRMIEGGGCGFNPKAPRHTIYPAGSNAPGALHFGIDLVKPADYIRKYMPDWEEPPVHVDMVMLDATVTAGPNKLIDKGFLCALRDPKVVELASQYGDPMELLETEVL